jgi:uncharacterized protein (TIGR03435 family)
MNMTIISLTGPLQSTLGKPVVDETGLTERFDMQLKWDHEAPDPAATLVRAVREQLGLEVTPARREIEVLVLRPAEAGQ